MTRHAPMETTGTGKGSKKRKSADDKAYKENLSKINFEEKQDLSFKLTVNGETHVPRICE